MTIKAKFKNGVFEPLEDISEIKRKYNNKVVEIEIVPKIEEVRGSLKHLKMTSVELQHKIKELW